MYVPHAFGHYFSRRLITRMIHHTRASGSKHAPAWFVLLSCAWVGCGNDFNFRIPAMESSPTMQSDAGPDRVASCDGANDGVPCGDAGRGMICLFNACVANACGDGIKAGLEECDDGNERDSDGCDSRCKTEPAPGCGNGVIEAGEACDDENTSNADQCTEQCTVARCGDRIVSLGEECDDGNRVDTDGCTNRCRTRSGSGVTAGRGGASAGRGGSPSVPTSGMSASSAGKGGGA